MSHKQRFFGIFKKKTRLFDKKATPKTKENNHKDQFSQNNFFISLIGIDLTYNRIHIISNFTTFTTLQRIHKLNMEKAGLSQSHAQAAVLNTTTLNAVQPEH